MKTVVQVLICAAGFGHAGNDIDEALRWALVELTLRRAALKDGAK